MFESLVLTIFFICEISFTGESISLRLSYFSVTSLSETFNASISIFRSDDSSYNRVFSSFNDWMIESFCLVSFLIWETSLMGESISRRHSYFPVTSLRSFRSCSFSLSNLFASSKVSCNFFSNWALSCFIALFSISLSFKSFFIWETSFTGESTSLRLSYLVIISVSSCLRSEIVLL